MAQRTELALLQDGEIGRAVAPRPQIFDRDHQRHGPRLQEVMPGGQFFQRVEPPPKMAWVQAAQGIIQQQDFRPQHEGAGQARSFLPGAPHRSGKVSGPGRQAGRVQNGLDAVAKVPAGQVPVIPQGEGDIFLDGQVVEQLAAVKNQTDAQAFGEELVAGGRHIPAEQPVAAPERRGQAGCHGQEIRLARAMHSAQHPGTRPPRPSN